MNMKSFIIHIFLLSAVFGAEYESKKITKTEYQDLVDIDKNIYDLSVKIKRYDTNQVAHFIYANLGYDLDFTRLKITSTANVRHSSAEGTSVYNETEIVTKRNSYSAGLSLTYPLFDKKESNDRKKQIILLKQKIIKEVQSYFKLKAKLDNLQLELKILLALEKRAKARKLDGVGGFNDWLTVIKDIKKANHDITDTNIELSEKSQILISYVIQKKEMKLKDML